MHPIARLLASSLLLLALPLSAAEVPGLYEVRQPVTSQSDEERSAAMGQALQQLAVRLTGNPQAASDSRLQKLLASPDALIQQYVYEQGQPLDLLVTFDPQQVTKALGAAGLTLWNPDRPQVLAWWISEGDSGTSLIVDNAADGSRSAELRAAAQDAGLPLTLPMGDLDEQGLTPAALLSRDATTLGDASARYSADVRLAVVERSGAADWVLWMGDEALSGKSQGADSRLLATALLRDVAAQLASRFTAGSASAETLLLEVDGVNLARYATLQRLLQPFNARLVETSGQRQRYLLQAAPAQLRAQLALARLQERPADPAAAAAGGTPVLHFGW